MRGGQFQDENHYSSLTSQQADQFTESQIRRWVRDNRLTPVMIKADPQEKEMKCVMSALSRITVPFEKLHDFQEK